MKGRFTPFSNKRRQSDEENDNCQCANRDSQRNRCLNGSPDRLDSEESRRKINIEVVSYGGVEWCKPNSDEPIEEVSVSDIIGSFGWFQLLVLLFSGLRELTVGYDAVVSSVILQPEENFLCADKPETEHRFSDHEIKNSTQFGLNETSGCYQSLDGHLLADQSGQLISCKSWSFPHSNYRASLVTEWGLVCDRYWLVAFIETAYFFGFVTGNLMWGYYADKIGRRKAYLVAHFMALIAGFASIFAPNVELFALLRFISAFGSIGYNIIYSIQIELIGTEHRSCSTILNHFGWGLGVICVPLMNHLFSNYRYIIAFAPVITLIMLPGAFWLPESSRWLMANGEYSRAHGELVRAARFNGKLINRTLDKKITRLQEKIKFDKMKQETISDKQSYRLLFTSPILLRDTIILAYISFAGHLFYYMLTINFAYMKNLSIQANFIISGAGEWISVIFGAVLLRICSRKACMSFFLALLTGSFIFQCLIDWNLAPSLDTQVIVTTNNAVGTLSALLLIFVTLIVNQEVYPTRIRQTGSSIVNTIGEIGSALAPTLIQLGQLIGLGRTNALCSIFCTIGILGAQFITRTDDIELQDT